MFIHATASYLPPDIIPNTYFEALNGLSNEWIIERTGIHERRKANKDQNTNTMAIQSVESALGKKPDLLADIDLIVGGTYTPYDTIVTQAHAIQHHFDLQDVKAITISSACSTLINAMEIVEGYFALSKSNNALVVVSEHNTIYNDEHDTKSGHLWGDGASALFISKEKKLAGDLKVIDIITHGAGNVGKGNTSVMLRPSNGGLSMPFGKDVFIHACQFMAKVSREIIEKNGYNIKDINYLIPHQANLRIIKKVASDLGIEEEKVLSNVQYLGNTGCAGCAIALSDHVHSFQKGNLIVLTVFGGGYSYGAMLLQKS